jgi:hypothetical protein
MRMQRLAAAMTSALTCGGASAFDSTEQATIDALQQQIVLLQTQLAQLNGSALTPEEVAALAWGVVLCLSVGLGVKAIKALL